MMRFGVRSALAGVLLAAAACAPSAPRAPNVVMIVVDTLRFDHLGCYGHVRNTSPHMDALAAEGVRFERAYATAPWTMPSVASMFTGLYPSSHRVLEFKSRLPDEAVTLAEILSESGYRTAGVVSHILLTAEHNFHQGFDEFVVSVERDPHLDVSSGRVTAEAERMLRGFGDSEQPFFLFVHYFDPHFEYIRHPEYGFAPESAGRLDGDEPIAELTPDLTPREIDFLRDVYDEEIRFTDDAIGRLIATLGEQGLDEDTIVVLTADHGEEFMEHGALSHGYTLYEELMRVPLIVRDPRRRDGPAVVPDPVSLVSLTPTILELVGLDPLRPAFQAASIASHLSAGAEPHVEPVFYEVDRSDEWDIHARATVLGRLKLVRDDGSGKLELYDLRDDPGEERNLAETDPDTARELTALLERRYEVARGEALEIEESPLTEEKIRALRDLGYVGGGR